MKDNNLLTKIVSLVEKKISLYQVILANGIISTFVFIITQNNVATWPMIESIPSLQRMNNVGNVYTTSDYLVNSNIAHSGRSPFLYVSHFILSNLQLTPEQYLAVGTALLVAFGPIMSFLTLIQTRANKRFGLKTFSILDCLVLCTLQYFLAHYGPRLALAGYSSYRFSLGLNGETLSIFLISLSLFGLTNTSLKFLQWIYKLILFLGIIIHPAVGVTFLTLWIILKLVNKNYKQIFAPTLPLILAAVIEIYLSKSGKNSLTNIEFTQIWSRLRVPHHMIPSYFFSRIFLLYFCIALVIVVSIRLVLKLETPFMHSFSLLTFVSGILFLQYVFVEKKSILIFSQLSLTRGFVFIGFSFCVFFYWIYEDTYMKFMKVHLIEVLKPQSLNKRFTVPLQLVLGLVLFFGVSNIESKVESTFRDLQHKITSQLSALGVSRGDVILLDPVSVDSQGWREYRFVNIWMDSYVPYDMESISKYRDRWLQFCGDKPMETCQYLTNQLNDKDFEAFLKTNNIDVIVRGTSSPKLLPHNWSRSAVSGSYEAFRK